MPDVRTTDGVKIAYQHVGSARRHAVSHDPGPRHGQPRLGAPARLVRPPAPLHRARQPRHRRAPTRPPGPYDLFRMADDAIAVLDAEGIDRAHIVGASMGGVIAQIIGVLHPERVRVAHARVHRVPPPRLAPRAARGVGRRRRRTRHAARWPRKTACAGSSARACSAASVCSINVLARVLMQTKPEPFVAQVDAILDASDELRDELATITVPDARDHRFAGHAHAASATPRSSRS